MIPTIVLVGRPNVGKSTLFNRLTGTRRALVADLPGVTRDRQYGFGKLGPAPYIVIDTGGLVAVPSGLELAMRTQTERAVEEADRLILLVDGRAGLSTDDHFVAGELRRAGKPVFLAVNKCEGMEEGGIELDFHALGLGEPLAISAAHGDGCRELMDAVLGVAATDDGVPRPPGGGPTATEAEAAARTTLPGIRIAIIGRPNVGKSTLVNRLIGSERVIASETPGTTRDSVFVPFSRDGREFVLIDTAGMRRRAKVEDEVEKASVAKTLQAIDEANVVIFVADAHDVIGEQDASVLGIALERGRALLIAVNKWDGIPMDQRDDIRRQLELKLDFVPYAPVHFISARHGTGVGELVAATVRAYEAAMRELATPRLTRTLERAIERHQPPLVHGRRIKLRYAHQGGRNPPRIIVHGNQVASVPEAYTRYLANSFRKVFDLFATPVSVEYRQDDNPYSRGPAGGRRAPARKGAGRPTRRRAQRRSTPPRGRKD